MVNVMYEGTVYDVTNASYPFKIPTPVPREALRLANAGDVTVIRQILTAVVMMNHRRLLTAHPWKCVECQKPATTLQLHPMSYLHLETGPMIYDQPGPTCERRQCQDAHNESHHQMVYELAGTRPGEYKPVEKRN